MNDMQQVLAGLRVLLVEDEPGLQEVFAVILELEGAKVTRASDGREALACLTQQSYDLIVTDYMMPRMNGAQLIANVRDHSELAAIPILLLSAALPHNVDSAIADAFLAKPVTVKRLLSAARALTGRQ